MSSQTIKKKKRNKLLFISELVGYTIVLLMAYFLICAKIHTKFISEYFDDIIGTFFIFLVPALLTILSVYIILLTGFRKGYLPKRCISNLKDGLAHASVFTIIIINSFVKFYKPAEGKALTNIDIFFLSDHMSEMLFTMTQPINYTYTIPLLPSILTLILLWLEYTPRTYTSKGTIEVYKMPDHYPTVNPNTLEKSRKIIEDTQLIIATSKNMLG